MNKPSPTDKDMAEFFRLGLSLGTCDVSQVVRWAEKVVEREEKPNHAFIELCLAENTAASAVISLLANIPGSSTTGLPLRMLLGHCWHIASHSPDQGERLLRPLYLMVSLEDFGSDKYIALVCLEDDWSLARDNLFGSIQDVMKEFLAFLQTYAADAPREIVTR